MNKKKNKLAALGISVCMALSVLVSPVFTLPVQAAPSSIIGIMPMRDAISWAYANFNNKLYKRLYNYSTGTWIGEWIYIRDLPVH